MSDLFDRVTSQQDVVKKLFAKIPGFKGYIERVDRRNADQLLRDTISEKFAAQWQRISSIQRDLVNSGQLEVLDDIEIASTRLRQFIDRIKTAAYGYSSFFEATKINEDELEKVYQYDLALVNLGDEVANAVDNLEASIGTDGFPAAIRNLNQKAQDCVDAFNKRLELMKFGE
jgi:hypothetical protein